MHRFNRGADFEMVAFIHGIAGQSQLSKVMWELICLPGDGILYFPILLPIGAAAWYLEYFPRLNREQSYLLTYLYVVLLVDLLLNFAMKGMVKRKRPHFHNDDMRFPGPDKYSFPSGHATRAGALVALFSTLLQYEPDLLSLATAGLTSRTSTSMCLTVAWTWAAINSFGRLALGRHFVSDVVVGTFIGYSLFFPVARGVMFWVYPPHVLAD
ncbi:hypothetical protein H310_06850 [Aphanomyces invadans]|uniref:Phosphatidic acid phosphatase type 2/haloperoxidase domain-containing protein n=1 Tax=Aphanomyces invadans TaxID=157072 RepID=A0A024U4V5_9STRA|nr:hypothetical protein H310_06850 [Aphanomyces invadans]ETW01280.1 hypothetical protein H310_06850 [Aphanomyces invadans]|eukprot:XP_008870278.1 hypothetical protein H310_06850 [Aphanomyces invadans]